MKPLALIVAVAVAAVAAGCTDSTYHAQLVARGELTLRYHRNYEMWAGGQRVTRGLGWPGLEDYVGCVGPAREQAIAARQRGRASIALAATSGSLAVISLGGLTGFADTQHQWEWLGSGLAVAGVAVVLAGTSRALRNQANGHAVDAMNHYNDAVGALGATCADLTYPEPEGAGAPAEVNPASGSPAPDGR